MKNLDKYTLKYSLLTVAALIGFFFLMKAVGLVHNFNLRMLNALIMGTGVYLCLRNLKRREKGHLDYLTGYGIGAIMSLIVAVLFAAFVGLYINIDTAFMEAIKEKEPMGIYLNRFAVVIVIFIEAMSSGVIFTFSFMQLFKDDVIPKVKLTNKRTAFKKHPIG